VTVLRLKSCSLGDGGGRTLAETLRINTTLASLDLWGNGLGDGEGRSLAEEMGLGFRV
jgi:hypothetical protein